jgi:hypothetical protein
MKHVRKEHIIASIEEIEADGKKTVNIYQKVFPSVNQAKRYNRLKLGGQAKVVAKLPKGNLTSDNATCPKEG